MIPVGLRAAPIATLGLLVAWSAADALSIRAPGATIPALEVLFVGVGVLVGAYVFRRPWLRPIGLTALLLAYVATHVFYLGVQLVAALAFVVLLMSHVELRILAGRFAHLYEAALSPADRARIRAALGRASLRLAIAAILAVVVPLLAADLAVAGVVPLTTIPSAILLAGGLVAVVLTLAILPSLRGRSPSVSERAARDAKDN